MEQVLSLVLNPIWLAMAEPRMTGSLDTVHWLDWLVLVGYFVAVSYLGIWLSGKQSSMSDFFRGGNRLPWYAVSASMIATILSAVTFIGVPAVAYRAGGNFSYLQFGIVAGLISRLIIALVMVPAYYKYDVYSPYDFMGRELGESARAVTTALFSLLGLLAQAARVYLTAAVLALVLHGPLTILQGQTGIAPFAWAVLMVGIVAVVWTIAGGIATVVWTDAMLFLVFVIGAVVAVAVAAAALPGGLWEGLTHIVSEGWQAEKFKLWSLQLQSEQWHDFLTEPYTIWAAFFAVSVQNVGAYGTDQLLAQRIFCCRGKAGARAAVLSSWAGELVVALLLLVGVGLWAFYRHIPGLPTGEAAQAVSDNPDNIFPVFILTQVPPGLRGLILAGIFAAAVSSLTSILAALSQTTLSALYLPLRQRFSGQNSSQREILGASRLLIVFWGLALCGMAFAVNAYVEARQAAGDDVPVLDIALGLANYVIGALFAAFLLAWLPTRINGYGLIWAAPLSVLAVFASRSHDPTLPSGLVDFLGGAVASYPLLATVSLAALLLVASWLVAVLMGDRDWRRRRLWRTPWMLAGAALLPLLSAYGWFAGPVDTSTGEATRLSIAWPWYAPLGGLTALLFGYVLADPRSPSANTTEMDTQRAPEHGFADEGETGEA
jgi:Na+/proline symporter